MLVRVMDKARLRLFWCIGSIDSLASMEDVRDDCVLAPEIVRHRTGDTNSHFARNKTRLLCVNHGG